ncbi:unnamed protein product [Orchesella dallaii]|uniref:DOMON domain-containing protein n=1 Tax=Orchesella dallaii TaxID=48710 RepID=A0ABP1Q7I8_9HEXA
MEQINPRTFLAVGVLLLFFFQWASCGDYLSEDNPYRHIAQLDEQGNYLLEWFVDLEASRITFNVTVATTGYIGFGLSRRGEVEGADIVIGGVDRNGRSYFTDRFGTGRRLPEVDASQDWTLNDAWERGSRTFLSFSRPFDTCDSEQDVAITDDLLQVIWTYGQRDDEIQTRFQIRGIMPVYLLDPDLVPRSLDDRVPNNSGRSRPLPNSSTRIFDMSTTREIPAQDTVYWCSFHKAPTTSKHHIIGFNTVFPTERDETHVHHLLLYRCHPPPGVDPATLFDTRSDGGECYFIRDPNPLNTQYCTEDVHLYAVGGRPTFFPEHVGMPLSASGGPEYYLLQTHYDNPDSLPDLRISFSLQAYYTPNIRENEAGMITLGTITPGSTTIIVPPDTQDHTIMGHCAPGCTDQMFPQEGITVFASFLHTHIAGRAARYHHFRGNRELPWILTDDNYDFNYQQYRVLREERQLLQGDLLVNSCTYDTTPRNGSAVIGGFSTREEMCTAFLWYYTRSQTHAFCRSELKTDEYLNLVGVRTTRWDPNRRAMVITSPARYRGISMVDYATDYIDWNPQMREEIQRRQIFDPQASQCPRYTPDAVPTEGQLQEEGAPFPSRNRGTVSQPQQPMSSFPANVRRYEPPSQCTRRGSISGSEGQASQRQSSQSQTRGGRGGGGRGGRGWSRN